MKRDIPSECGGCSLEEKWLLHNICVRQTYRRLCTSCVLKLNSGSFCPICFEVYDGSKLPANRVMCSRCPSVAHPDCLRSKGIAISTFVCPPCSNPNFTFFDSNGKDKDNVVIDEKMGRVLVAAGKIALSSMSKAANGARLDADRKVKEAALKRKEAREALQRLYAICKKGKETVLYEQPVPINVMMGEREKKVKIFKGGSSTTTAAIGATVVAQQRFESQSSVEGTIRSDDVGVHSKRSMSGQNSVDGIIKSGGVGVNTKRFVSNQSSVEANIKPGRVALSSNNKDKVEGEGVSTPVAVNEKKLDRHVQNNFALQENDKLQNSRNNPDTGGQGKPNGCIDSETGRQIPQPNQDALVQNSKDGVLLGSSNTAS